MLGARRKIKLQQQINGEVITLIAQIISPSLPLSPIAPPFLAAQPLSIVGHIDIGPMNNYDYITPIPPAPAIVNAPEDNATTLEIQSFYVHPVAHRTGCAQRLFASGVRDALRKFPQCAARMTVVTFELNSRARAFYIKLDGKFVGAYSGN